MSNEDFLKMHSMARTNSSCSLTKRSLRALPKSDRAREGVDMGVRPLGQILLCAGDVVNVIGENAMPVRTLFFT